MSNAAIRIANSFQPKMSKDFTRSTFGSVGPLFADKNGPGGPLLAAWRSRFSRQNRTHRSAFLPVHFSRDRPRRPVHNIISRARQSITRCACSSNLAVFCREDAGRNLMTAIYNTCAQKRIPKENRRDQYANSFKKSDDGYIYTCAQKRIPKENHRDQYANSFKVS